MDLRNYFSPKPKPKSESVEEKKKPEPEKKRTSARKKTVIHDTDEEDEAPTEVKSKHFAKEASASTSKSQPAEKTVDPKAFFASSKSKKAQSSSTKEPTKAIAQNTSSMDDTKKVKVELAADAKVESSPTKEASSKDSTGSVAQVKSEVSSDQTSAKSSATANHSKKSKKDDYFEDDDDEIVVKPKKRAAVTKAKAKTPEPEPEPVKVSAPQKKVVTKSSNSKKRKGANDDDDDDDAYNDENDDDIEHSKPVKRARSSAKKVAEVDDNAMDIDEPKEEKPKPKFNFWAYKNKAGPSALGSKEIPVGQDNCFAGWTFVFTGELSSITRDDASDLVKRYSGRVTSAPSRKTTYVVVGDDAGQSKLDKVKNLGLKTLNEDEFLDLIRTSPAKNEDGSAVMASTKSTTTKAGGSSSSKVKKSEDETKASPETNATPLPLDSDRLIQSELWTTKYRPKSLKDLCGNTAAINRLQRWLENWDKCYKENFKIDGADKTGTFRAVLISGPPGIGKTSAAHLVGKTLGYNIAEFNASDTRSKNSLDSQVRVLLDNQSLAGYFQGDTKLDSKEKSTVDNSNAKKQLIIMDEVDGMAAGDRGGIAQLITFIKKTHVPIICICNDRQSPKVRSLVNSCFDMRFQRPQVNHVRSRLMTILHREGRKIPGNVLDKLVAGSQSDIRQVLNMISTWSLTKQEMNYDEGTALSKASEKYVALNPFEIADRLLIESNYRALSFADKFDMYFNDYQLAPLMIQENYVRMNPAESRNDPSGLDAIERMSKAADSLSDADLVDSLIHGSAQHWSLMPTHAAFSCVRPSFYVHGSARPGPMGPMMQFPGFLGQNSKAAKYNRIVKELQIRMRLKISGDKNEVRQNYLPVLFSTLTKPLVEHGVGAISELIELMDSYYLSKEDWDAILELGIGRNDGKKVMDSIPPATKSTFTRTYNSEAHPQPFLKPTTITKTKGGEGKSEEVPDNLDVVEADAEVPEETDEAKEAAEEESIEKDKNIKQKKVKGTAAAKAKTTKGKSKTKK